MFNSHSNIENGNVDNSLPWTNISNEQDLKQFLKNACENISKRGSFMSILMRLRSADNPKLKEISDEYFNIIPKLFTQVPVRTPTPGKTLIKSKNGLSPKR